MKEYCMFGEILHFVQDDTRGERIKLPEHQIKCDEIILVFSGTLRIVFGAESAKN